MLLAVDVGNTQTVLGLYEGYGDSRVLRHMWRVSTNKEHTSDELRVVLQSLFDVEGLVADDVRGLSLASVVPYLTQAWQLLARKMFAGEILVVDAEMARGIFETSYANPAEIGADRVADAVAARALYGAPVVVVDFGTATNIEVIDAQGCFVGGIIAPGITTSAAALFSSATRLASIDLVDPSEAIGRNTREALQSGIIYGEADRVDGLVKRVFEQLGYETPVVATGGLSEAVIAHTKSITEVNPELTLEGLRIIYEYCGPSVRDDIGDNICDNCGNICDEG